MKIWINPACSKCRAATEALDRAGIPYDARRYLETPPTAEELTAVLAQLRLEPWDITRMSEPAATSAGLDALPRDAEHRSQWIAALVANPILIQRPILVARDGTAYIGRTPEALEQAIAAERR